MDKKWFINRTNPEFVDYISKNASISPLLARVLINRGIKTPEDIHSFLNPDLSGLSDPFELPDMRKAVDRVRAALQRSERVLVHGDYDADGLTATAIMYHALKTIGLEVHYFIPNRMLQGYGFNPYSVEAAEKIGARLIITVDCGISSTEAVACANKAGIDVIITDHHEPSLRQGSGVGVPLERLLLGEAESSRDFLLPEAAAVINPKLMQNSSPMINLSGAGVALKFGQALSLEGLNFGPEEAMSLVDLAALGTIADVVPLTGENRLIIKEGLRYIHKAARPGINSLKEVAGLNGKEIKAGLLAYTLVPRINAAGRIGDANEVVAMFLSESESEAYAVADKLDKANTERQKIEEEVYQEALAQLKEKGHDAAIVLYKEGWHMGVVGIVASRLAEAFCRPAFIFAVEDGIAKGSSRSIPQFNIHESLSECSSLLISFGGHKQAAGVKLSVSDMDTFTEKINGIVRNSLKGDAFVQTVEVDSEISLSEVNPVLVKELSMLEPFGHGNPEPLFGAKGLSVLNPKIVGRNHLKLRLKQNGQAIDAIGFSMGKYFERLAPGSYVDAAFTPTINEWNGGKYLQLNVKAFRHSV